MKNNRKVTRQYVLKDHDQKTIILALRMYEKSLDDTFDNIIYQFGDHADYSSVHSHQFDLQGLIHLMHEKILINVTSTIDSDKPDDYEKWGDDNKDQLNVDFPDWNMDMKILEEEPKTTIGMKSLEKDLDIDQFEDPKLTRFNIMEMKKNVSSEDQYRVFCMFSQLSKEETKGYDCDEMWGYCHDLYSTFCDSEFNDDNISEIDAMNKFLENIEERIAWCKDNPPLKQYLIEGSEYDFEMLKMTFEHTSSFELPKLFELKNSHEKGELWYEKIEDEEVSHG